MYWISLALAAPLATTDASSAEPLPASIEALIWLEGCWSSPTGRTRFQECWTREGQELVGTGSQVRRGRENVKETLVLRDVDGQAVYVASPVGAQPVPFGAAAATAPQTAVFENPEHDFPQRIAYQRSDDTLTVDVSGDGNGFTLVLTRTP